MTSRTGRAVLAALVLIAGLGLETASVRKDLQLDGLWPLRRVWTDMAMAINRYLDSTQPDPGDEEIGDPVRAYGEVLVERTQMNEIRAHEFWKTLRAKPFLPYRAHGAWAAFDDPGRAWLLSWGFRLLGGISPFLILWLGLLAAAPVIVWLWIEFGRAGWWPGGVIFSASLLASPFVVESLSLPRYAVGFYLVAALAAVAVIVPAVAPEAPTLSASAWRAAIAGGVLALAISCRSSVVLMLPGFLVAMALAAGRGAATNAGRGSAFLAFAALLLSPWLLTRSPVHHDVWPPLWEGLGDFDRKYDHTWSDEEATRFARAAGLDPSIDFRRPEAEPIFRKAVLDHISSDPIWYAAILSKRLASTLTLSKLWSFGPTDGTAIQRKTSPNEGAIDKYFGYTTTVDFVGFGRARCELPAFLFLAPSVLLLSAALSSRFRSTLTPYLRVLACAALVLLPLPVLVTTAGAQETQTFALIHMLSAAFLTQAIFDHCRETRTSRRGD